MRAKWTAKIQALKDFYFLIQILIKIYSIIKCFHLFLRPFGGCMKTLFCIVIEEEW